MRRLFVSMLLLLAPLAAGCSQLLAPETRDLNLPEESEPAWVALSKPCPADAPAYSVPDHPRRMPPAGGHPSIDDRWAALARQVPGGWGGVFYENGQLVMVLVNPAERDRAIAALEQLLDPGRDARLLGELHMATVKPGRWDFAQLYDWYHYLNQGQLSGGITSSDIDEANNRITYGVKDEDTRARVTQDLDELDIPCFLVALQIRGYAIPLR